MEYVSDLGKILSEHELSELKALIRANTQLWTHDSLYWSKHTTTPKHFIGSPIMYPVDNSYLFVKRYEELRPISEEFLKNYAPLQKVLTLLEQKYQRPATQLHGSSLPGFEIYSTLNGRNDHFDSTEFHQDSCATDYWDELPSLRQEDKFEFSTIHACITPIELPEVGRELEYRTPEGIQKTAYVEGHLYVWKSDMPHRPTFVKLKEGDLRICYIIFFSLQPDKILYYL